MVTLEIEEVDRLILLYLYIFQAALEARYIFFLSMNHFY